MRPSDTRGAPPRFPWPGDEVVVLTPAMPPRTTVGVRGDRAASGAKGGRDGGGVRVSSRRHP
ncbi:MAG TPA: hypothetical protein DC048_06415 [Planctomycetaceae bacterium]|nr:hypothetical protein [Planctomycetaceae bacterium]